MRKWVFLILTLCLNCQAIAESKITGTWFAALECPGGEIRFGLIINEQQGSYSAWISNGEEKVKIPTLKVTADQIELSIDHYDSQITARLVDDSMRGSWRKRRGPNDWVKLDFHASRKPRKVWQADGANRPGAQALETGSVAATQLDLHDANGKPKSVF
ncbi:MAG: hypothetical protein AAGA30_18070, partial [Planctomycetota bacterium]